VLNYLARKQPKSRLSGVTLIAATLLAIASFPGNTAASDLVSLLSRDGHESLATRGSTKPEKISRRWTRSATEIDQLLVDGQWAEAAERSEALLADMHEALISGGRSWLGGATTLRAVAQAGLGKKKLALWDRSVALSLFPRSRNSDLSSYGEAGRIVEEVQRAFEWDVVTPHVHKIGGQVGGPEKVATPQPRFPVPQEAPFRIAVQVVVDAKGRTREPRIQLVAGPVPLAFLAADALKDWQFEPSTLDGEPIDVLYVMTFSGG